MVHFKEENRMKNLQFFNYINFPSKKEEIYIE